MKYTDVIARVPVGKLGIAEIVHDSPDQFTRMRAAMNHQPLNRETYARLLIDGSVMMTDAEFERLTNLEVIRLARGDVLVAGLGLGLILDPLIERCDSVTVVEKSADVIALVGPSFPKCRIIHADIFKWQPESSTYDTIYFDIWGDICGDDLEAARKLHRLFRKRLRVGGWMASWVRIALKVGRR